MHNAKPNEATSVAPQNIVEHLEAVLASPSFVTSKRSQQFLRYIVLETANGRGTEIKERNIAHEVFGRGVDFEPGEESLVRVKAREVRKRLTEYYESATNPPIRIDLPVGGYVPQIHIAQETTNGTKNKVASSSLGAPHINRRRLVYLLSGFAAAISVASLFPFLVEKKGVLDELWAPVFATKTPLLVFIPILKDRNTGAPSDRVGIGPAAALRRAADFLTQHKYPYLLRFGADLTYSQLREQPSLLLGGYSSIWTLGITRNLRFNFQANATGTLQLYDGQTHQAWQATNMTYAGYADEDYGILSRLFDTASGQVIMIAGGITTFGTEGAACVFFDSGMFGKIAALAPKGWEKKNFQAVIRVSIIGATPSTPQIVATHFW